MTHIEAAYGKAVADRMERDAMTHGPALGELLLSEIGRLRALVKAGEWPAVGDGNHVCQHCDAGFYETSISRPPHKPDCPAFTPDGSVR